MHGLGNSYIYVDGFHHEIPKEEQLKNTAIRVANPYTGIGSDGMILILPSNKADVRMRVFNNDGSEAKNCGNGLRCVSKYVYEASIVRSNTFTIETLGGIVTAQVHPKKNGHVDEVTVDMGIPALERAAIPMRGNKDELVINERISFGEEVHALTAISMGNPHAVLFSDHLDMAHLQTVGPLIEQATIFPEGTNVEFIQMKTEQEIDFAVWERGSGITQACGTGACAAVVAAVLNEKSKKDEEVTVHLPGGDLYITWSSENDHVWMRGKAATICSGEFYF
ncbi:diaminopimelate epimerase [Geomicrobium sp. JSM 1781026]|uniref:diaminopimelate epimerase n=1 Tax=Geomicrobium sp. JSM 1781026 TaxID=3344580 RepID=UPI0035C25C27